MPKLALLIIPAWLIFATGLAADDLAELAHGVLQQHCSSCHGGDEPEGDLDVLDYASLTTAQDDEAPAIVAGKPDDSRLWTVVDSGDMPPEDEDQLSPAEKHVLKQWIAAGAAKFVSAESDLPTDEEELVAKPKPEPTSKAIADVTPVSEHGKIAKAAYEVLHQNCYSCHGGTEKERGLDVMDRDLMLITPSKSSPFVAPFHPDRSPLWRAIENGSMPKGKGKELTKTQKKAIRKWIEIGAPKYDSASPSERTAVTLEDALDAVVTHLRRNPNKRPFLRYFSLTHLWNDPTVTDAQMRIYRAALSKTLNSLTRESVITRPKQVDSHGTVYAIDVRDFGWDRMGFWPGILAGYPYGIQPTSTGGARDAFRDAVEMMGPEGCDVPLIRADWFVAHALQSPRYDRFLNLPETLQQLENQLGVKRVEDYQRNRLRRAGFTRSGISRQSRLVDRHRGRTGTYWISYDFKSNDDKSNPIRFPLGPTFANHPHPKLAFEEAGSEIIFELENGLHGYLIAQENGQKITKAPIEIVADVEEFSGSPVIVNGLSCISCHSAGIKRFTDTIREGFTIRNPNAMRRINELFADGKEMQRLVDSDRRDYLNALESAIGPFVLVGEDSDKSIDSIPEPISQLVARYHGAVPLERLAYELGVDADDLARDVRTTLANFGFGPLRRGVDGAVHRFALEAKSGGVSVFQEAAAELMLGVPQSLK